MADRPTSKVSRETLITPAAPADTSSLEVQAAQRFSQQLFGIADQGQDILDDIAVQDATVEGAIAGRDVNFKPRRDRSLSGQAYDKAARLSYGMSLEINARKQAAEAFAQFGNDPTKLADALTGYRVGIVSEINDTFPELVGEFDSVYSRITEPLVQKASDDFLAGVSARALGDSTDFVDTLSDDAARRSADITTPEQSAVDVALDRVRLVQHLSAHGPQTAFEVDGVVNEADPDRITLYSPKQIVDQLIEFDERMIKSRVLGGVDAAIKGGAGVSYIRQFQEFDAGLAPEFKEEIISEMIGRLNREQGLQAKAETASDDQRVDRWDAGEQAVTVDFLAGNLSIETLQQRVKKDQIKPSLARTLSKQIGDSGPIVDDAAAVLEYTIDPLAVSEDEILADTRLTFLTRGDLIGQRRQLLADLGNWRNSQDGQEAVRRVQAEFGIVSGVEALLDPDVAKRAGRTLTELFEAIEALPPEERAARAVEISDSIIGRSKSSDVVESLSRAENALANKKHQTIADLDADSDLETILGGKTEEYRVLKKQLMERMRKIERLKLELSE